MTTGTGRGNTTQSDLLSILQKQPPRLALQQCWNWIFYDATFWESKPRQEHAQYILSHAPSSFLTGILYTIHNGNGQDKFYELWSKVFVLLKCPSHLDGTTWYTSLTQIPYPHHTEIVRRLARNADARRYMGPSHVLIRLANEFGVRCLRTFVRKWDEKPHALAGVDEMQRVFTYLVFEMLHKRRFRTQLMFDPQYNIECGVTADDFKDMLAMGWRPDLSLLIELPFEWLNLLLPLVYLPHLKTVLSWKNPWNYMPIKHLANCEGETNGSFSQSTASVLKREWMKDTARQDRMRTYVEGRFGRYRMKQIRRNQDWNRWERLPVARQPLAVTWKFMHPEQRLQLFNLVHKASPLIREKFTHYCRDASIVELIKPDSLSEYFQACLASPSAAGGGCHCSAMPASLDHLIGRIRKNEKEGGEHKKNSIHRFAHERSCVVNIHKANHTLPFLFCPWLLKPFNEDVGMLYLSVLQHHYVVHDDVSYSWKPHTHGHIEAIAELLAVCYARNLHVSTILGILQLTSVVSESLLKEKALREVLSAYENTCIYGQVNVYQRVREKYLLKDPLWISILSMIEKCLR